MLVYVFSGAAISHTHTHLSALCQEHRRIHQYPPPGGWKPDVIRPGIVGGRESKVLWLRPCMVSSIPPHSLKVSALTRIGEERIRCQGCCWKTVETEEPPTQLPNVVTWYELDQLGVCQAPHSTNYFHEEQKKSDKREAQRVYIYIYFFRWINNPPFNAWVPVCVYGIFFQQNRIIGWVL